VQGFESPSSKTFTPKKNLKPMRGLVAALLVALAAFLTGPAAGQLPAQLNITDVHSHRDLGFRTGLAFRGRIAEALKAMNATLAGRLVPFYETAAGRRAVDLWLGNARKIFPKYYEEMEGLAAGAGVPLHLLSLVNLEDDIEGMLAAQSASSSPLSQLARDHCSDISYVDPKKALEGRLMGHNEDAESFIKSSAYLLRARVQGSDFMFYTYPGVISGNAFGFNAHGLVLTCNAVFPRDVFADGQSVPRNFVTRAAIDCRTVEEVRELLRHTRLASGFSLTVGSWKTGEIVNFEMNGDRVRETPHTAGNYSHFNMYEHLAVPQHTDESTVHRLKRYDELPAARSWETIRAILGDTKDPVYPIYRDGKSPDCCATVATGAFDLGARTFGLYDNNPKLHPEPLLSFALALD
jgi:Acyl-coenzyme A:6-aminopenicillanic acid acyl-transferase